MIAAEDGCSDSLDVIQDLYSKGHALQLYQEYLSEIKSRQREEEKRIGVIINKRKSETTNI